MKFDFHCHSNYSDGLLSPEQLIDYAAERNIDVLSLTDHDSITGLEEAQKAIEHNQYEMTLVGGVEISAKSEFGEIHIVGLNIDPTNLDLVNALDKQQKDRWVRAQQIQAKLQKLKIEGVYEHLEATVRQVVTRSHIARGLVDLGFAKDMQQAFKKYIGKKGRAKVSQEWMPMERAIELIKDAGGIAILAHPTRYPVSNRKLALLIEAFAQEGGEAIETAYPSLNKDKAAWLELHRDRNNLMASSGSDFHYPNLRWTDLGRFPYLSNDIPHVKERIIS